MQRHHQANELALLKEMQEKNDLNTVSLEME